ncbi:MAG: DUF488 domain-containing protein [Flavobacteriales bacterium]|nr:DUF488 domain-containing protein [Flavobacteriales bacterium]MCW8937657.1 DUF488 domain-containing protein [Flavobacteriales bacterium]MCW8967581.1 DUF488 domain-containing protein [Flavobacteriales bacterium]MCW8990145.1 DUF488 domain-containing protein [Flavobacteriales bacterium]MCW9019863.1 DUF488 domain-containing protein [Flavobacteriales bacterium]
MSRKNSILAVSIIAMILIFWLIFELDKKDKKIKELEKEKLKGLKNKINHEELEKDIKDQLINLIDKYQGINPRVAFELVKALTNLNIGNRPSTFLILVNILENILTNSYSKDILFVRWFIDNSKNKIPSINDYVSYATILGTLTESEHDFIVRLTKYRSNINENSEKWISINLLEIIELILKLDTVSSPQILSIGYGNRSIEEFILILKRYQISSLIDVRSAPYSKYNSKFSQNDLKSYLNNSGITYDFMGDNLGGRPNDLACYTEGKVDYETIRTKEFFKKGINNLLTKASKKRVVIMCSEGKPHECHRSKLIGKELVNNDVSIIHIDHNSNLRSQNEVMLLATKGVNDTSLFGEEQLKSRKKYI